MVPGCVDGMPQRTDNVYGFGRWTPDELYPEHRYRPDTLPGDIRDWIDHRKYLVDAWKSSCEEFLQEFTRGEKCWQSW